MLPRFLRRWDCSFVATVDACLTSFVHHPHDMIVEVVSSPQIYPMPHINKLFACHVTSVCMLWCIMLLARQDLSCTYLAHHELERGIVVMVVVIIIFSSINIRITVAIVIFLLLLLLSSLLSL